MDLKRLVEKSDTPAGRWFDNTVFALIVVSLVTFSIETLPNLSPNIAAFLWWAEVVTVVLFTIEYLLRISVAERRWQFLRSFVSLIDLAAILPFYLSLGAIDLRALRTFRLLRLLRILKLARYGRVVRRMHRAFVIVREEMILFLSVALMLIFLSAVGIYYFERTSQPELFASVFHSLWWAFVTLTTVGYGDAYPITLGGRIFTVFVLVAGVGVVAAPTGLFASALAQVRKEEETEGYAPVRDRHPDRRRAVGFYPPRRARRDAHSGDESAPSQTYPAVREMASRRGRAARRRGVSGCMAGVGDFRVAITDPWPGAMPGVTA